MFCPNCGNNCADANFCPKCGTKLRQDSKLEEILPITNSNRKRDIGIRIPTSSGFLGESGTSVVLNDSSVTVCTGLGHQKQRKEIPYDQLVTVIYLRPTYKPWRLGALLFRGEDNKDVPIPDIKTIGFDSTAVKISLDKDELFYHIFQMLKAVASPTASFKMIIPENKIRNLDEKVRNVDMEYIWNTCAPFRSMAASKIHAEYRIKTEVARVLVDREFDARQKTRYDADTLDAVRDLNLIAERNQNGIRIKTELREYQQYKETERSLHLINSRLRYGRSNKD